MSKIHLRRFVLAIPMTTMPLLLGAARPWLWPSIAALFLLEVCVLMWVDHRLSFTGSFSKCALVAILPVVVLPFLQAVPMPLSVLEFLSPHKMLWMHKAGEITDMRRQWGAVSYAPLTTFFAGIWYLFLVVYAGTLSHTLKADRNWRWLFIILFAMGAFEAFYGILQVLIPSLGVLWEAEGEGIARGTYVNRNHYACFLNMVWPLLLAYTLGLGEGQKVGRLEGEKIRSGHPGYRAGDRLSQVRQKQIFFGFIIGLVLFALFFSMSRGGILGSLVALTVFVTFGRFKSRKALFLIFGCWTVLLIYGSIVGFGEIWARFEMTEGGALGRLKKWKDCWPIVADHWLTGAGLGTFGDIFMVYQTHLLDTQKLSYAHNDYLQIVADLGVPVTVFLIFLVWGYWWKTAWKAARGEEAGWVWIENDGWSNPRAQGGQRLRRLEGEKVRRLDGERFRRLEGGEGRRVGNPGVGPGIRNPVCSTQNQTSRIGNERSIPYPISGIPDYAEQRRLVAAGALAGSAAFLFHAWVEFNWQIPANALYFVMLLVLMQPSIWRRERE